MTTRLHIVFDPLCGWCYAASPMLRKVQEHFAEELPLVFHPGLLFAQPNLIPASYREHIIEADQHIASLCGVQFGSAYLNKVRTSPELRYHSVPAAMAVMSMADESGATSLLMLEKIQQAHYVEARDVSDVDVLTDLAQETGLAARVFKNRYTGLSEVLPTQARQASQLLAHVGAQGFPTFVLEAAGQFHRLNHSAAYRDMTLFIAEIERQLEQTQYG